jgi:bifunctional DNA-binding transcriptional regulator/antitoxin component of YhaV-PrlF toxin-antitoxin module
MLSLLGSGSASAEPRDHVRERLGVSAGQKIQAVLYGDRIELIPLQPAKRLRGFLKGIDTSVAREPDRA